MNTQTSAIVKVKVPNYRPACVKVRVDISDLIFTCDVFLDNLDVLRQDAKVESITVSEPIQLQKLPVMNEDSLYESFSKHTLLCGRMIAAHKIAPKGNTCVWNANIVCKSSGKIWFGDLNITKEGNSLKEIAAEIGETLYVLRESDCRFNTEKDPIDLLISRAIWNTDMEIPHAKD